MKDCYVWEFSYQINKNGDLIYSVSTIVTLLDSEEIAKKVFHQMIEKYKNTLGFELVKIIEFRQVAEASIGISEE